MFPVHYDPIDNGFRPDIDEVSELFPDCKVIRGRIVTDYTYSQYLFRSPKNLFFNIARLLAFFYKFDKWRKVVVPKYEWLFKNYKTTCVLFQKKL